MKYKFETDIMVARFIDVANRLEVGIFGVGMEWPGNEESRIEFRKRVEAFNLLEDTDKYIYTGYGYLVNKDTEVEIDGFEDKLDLIFKPGTPKFEFPQSVVDSNRKAL